MKSSTFFAVLVAAMFAAGCASNPLAPSATPNPELQRLQAELATKADKAEVARVEGRVGAVSNGLGLVNIKADDVVQAVGELKGRADKIDSAAAELQGQHSGTQGRVAALERSVDRAMGNIVALEKSVIGVRAATARAVGRLGALEDSQGIDHDKRLFRLSGFPTAKLNDAGELIACAEISAVMQTRIAELKKIVAAGGWAPKEIAGFADERPFRKAGKVLDNSDELNAVCAQLRADAVAGALGSGDAVGRGATTKFGGQDMNRAALVYLERVTSRPTATPSAPATAPTAPAAALPATK